ncbi:MAG: methyltransferase [Candidatus Aenigmatarchaeota archaeon]
MKKKIEQIISELSSYENPKVELEQYETPSYLIAEIVNELNLMNLVEDKIVLEPACGTAKFSIAISFFNPKFVVAFDIDKEAIRIAKENYEKIKEKFETSKIYFLIADVRKIKFRKKFDLIVMNPPFGIQGKIKDLEFLDFATKNSNFICSINPNGKNKEFFTDFLSKRNFSVLKFVEKKFELPKTFWFHKKKKKLIDVVIIFAKNENIE